MSTFVNNPFFHLFLELFYRRIVFKKWMKPGVFRGCYLPLYGMGLVICYFCYLLPLHLIFRMLLVVILLTFIELLCGIIFIRKLKIPLWDYNNEFFNYKGLICLKYSLYWLLLAIVFFIVFSSVSIPINRFMNFIVIGYEIILIVDVTVFFVCRLVKNKKRNFHLDL